MEEYLSERQEIDQLKGWIKENAAWAVGGLAIGFALLFGIKQWNAYTAHKAEVAAAKYQDVLVALSRNDTAAADKLVAELHSDFSRTPYGDLADLAYVRVDAEAGRLEPAAKRLESVLEHSRDSELALVAKLRLARIDAGLGKFDEALKVLGDNATPAFADIRGDVQYLKGDKPAAVKAWNEALASDAKGLDHQILELKITAAGGAVAPPAGVAP